MGKEIEIFYVNVTTDLKNQAAAPGTDYLFDECLILTWQCTKLRSSGHERLFFTPQAEKSPSETRAPCNRWIGTLPPMSMSPYPARHSAPDSSRIIREFDGEVTFSAIFS